MPLSLLCPRCSKSVTVPDSAAGTRVSCPHCAQAFLAPGLSATTAEEEDDWLSLDSDPVPPTKISQPKISQTKRAITPPMDDPFGDPSDSIPVVSLAPSQPNVSPPATYSPPLSSVSTSAGPKSTNPPPALSSEEETLLNQFSSGLDDFTATVEAVPKPRSNVPSNPAGLKSPKTGVGGRVAPSSTMQPLSFPPIDKNTDLGEPLGTTPTEVEYATEYRVTCLTCGSQRMATASQVGKSVTCNDCHSPIRVPAPPRVPKKVKIDMDTAPVFSFGATQVHSADRPADPYRKSAQQYLDEAARVEETSFKHDDDTPSLRAWLASVFGIFRDVGVVAHWFALSLLGAFPAAIALSTESELLHTALIPAGIVFGVMIVSCGYAILQSVANEESRVSEWPVFDPMSWFENLIIVFSAAGFSIIPVYALGHITLGPSLITTAITMFSLFSLFPFVLLSMLDLNSPLTPFSAEVTRSVTKAQESWGGFYFTAAILFFFVYVAYCVASTMSAPIAAAGCVFLTVAAAFIYFAMIGRLAYAIGQEPMVTKHVDSSE